MVGLVSVLACSEAEEADEIFEAPELAVEQMIVGVNVCEGREVLEYRRSVEISPWALVGMIVTLEGQLKKIEQTPSLMSTVYMEELWLGGLGRPE